ncbi:hypothetical protein NIES2101_24200 [Calothrix sp. HK-06]|nr:hypothetical protein NIES2101_24200 [Calothrix sp. HK-06]
MIAYSDFSIQLDIAGDGWDKQRLEKLAYQMGLNNRIVWHGWCKGEKLEKLYNQSSAVIFPSVWHEPAGLITLEAYARYRPIIASAVDGIPEHVRKETGIVVESNNIDQLAGAISDLSNDYQKSRVLGEQGHALLMQELTLEIHTQRLQRIYD